MAFTPVRVQDPPVPLPDATAAGIASPAKRVHLAFLDGIRALAALYIVCHHAINFGITSCVLSSNGDELCQVVAKTSNGFMGLARWLFHSFGQEAVAVFICLSGFCLMIPVARNTRISDMRVDALPFFVKRAKRILPPYYASIAFSLLMIATLIGSHTQGVWDLCLPSSPNQIVTKFDLFTHLLLIQDFFRPSNGRIDGPLWSVAAEWRIYFAFPLLIWAWRKYRPISTTAAILIAAVLAHPLLPRVFRHLPVALYVGPTQFVPEYFALFSLGVLAAGIALTTSSRVTSIRMHVPWGTLSAISLLLVVLARSRFGEAILAHVPDYFGSTELTINLLVGFGACSLMAGLTLGHWTWLRSILGSKPLVFVGTISYSLYLIHYPIEEAILRYLVVPMRLSSEYSGLIMIVFALPITLGCSCLFYRVVEKPSHIWATKRTPKVP